MLCVVFGVANMWFGIVKILEELSSGFYLCGIRGQWKKSKNVSGSSLLLACSFGNVDDQFIWDFVGVYGPKSSGDRRFGWLVCLVGRT